MKNILGIGLVAVGAYLLLHCFKNDNYENR